MCERFLRGYPRGNASCAQLSANGTEETEEVQVVSNFAFRMFAVSEGLLAAETVGQEVSSSFQDDVREDE